MGDHRLGDRRARRDRTATQVVAEREAPGDADDIGAGGQFGVLVPDAGDLGAGGLEGHGQVAVAVRAGKGDDGRFHGSLQPWIWPPFTAQGPRGKADSAQPGADARRDDRRVI